jgi:hypothetical protein
VRLAPRVSFLGTPATVAAIAVAVAACAPTQTSSPTAGPRPVRANAAPAPTRLPSRYPTGHFVYDIQSVGVVSAPRDTGDHPDTVVTHSIVTYDARFQDSTFRINGSDQYWTAGTGRLKTSVPGQPTAAPSAANPGASSGAVLASQGRGVADSAPPDARKVSFDFRVDTTTGAVRRPADSAAVPGCPVGGPVEQDEALISDRPRSFAAGTQWADSAVRVSCLIGIPVTTRTTRTFRVADAVAPDPVTGAQSIVVTYQTNVSWDGEARRRTDLVTLHATGVGTGEQYYDASSGMMLSAHTATAFDLDAAVNGKVQQHLHQDAQRSLRRRLEGRK